MKWRTGTVPKGCYVNARRRPIRIGERIHRLTAIEQLSERGYHGCIAWKCRCECGTEVIVEAYKLRSGRRKSCGCLLNPMIAGNSLRRGELNYHWTGGRTLNSGGYVHVYAPEHPKHSKDNYVLEHVQIMERELGRYLFPGETVHRKNGQKTDNRLENLELWASAHPPGQRVVDLVCWAREILSR